MFSSSCFSRDLWLYCAVLPFRVVSYVCILPFFFLPPSTFPTQLFFSISQTNFFFKRGKVTVEIYVYPFVLTLHRSANPSPI